MSAEFEWSSYQQNIFKDVAEGEGHSFIDALAGSSKTTTIIESLKYVPKFNSCLLVAFNKKIADELKLRVHKGFNGDMSTLHSLGLRSISRTFRVVVDTEKCEKIIQRIVGKSKDNFDLRYKVGKAVSLSKGALCNSRKEIDNLIDEYDIDLPIERDQFIDFVFKTLKACKNDTKSVDFDDMIWFCNIMKIDVSQYDMIFVDEGQDLNKGQFGLVKKTITDQSRLFVFSDKCQSIYKFMGAGADALLQIRALLKPKSLPLSICYRCPTAVIKEAQRLVPAIEASPTAAEGIVQSISYKEMEKLASPGCFILSRSNAPLIGWALKFIAKGVPANIQGKDLGINLKSLIKKSKAKKADKFLEYLDKWSKREVERLKTKERPFEHILDKVECFEALAEGCEDVAQIVYNIDILFADTNDYNKIILSTVHRAKGLERDVVFMLKSTFKFFNQEEKNLNYVAITRAKKELYFVTKDG